MRSRAPLAVVEQMVMILVFAVCAALCLRLFAASDGLSRESAARDGAVALAQSAAETVRHFGGDVETALAHVGGEWYGEDWEPVPGPEEGAYRLSIEPLESGVAGLGKATVSVTDAASGAELFRLEIAWQEVGADG